MSRDHYGQSVLGAQGTANAADARLRTIERDLDRKITWATHMHAQTVSIEVDGEDSEVDILLEASRIKSRPLGMLCVEALSLDNPDMPGSLGTSVPWTYRAVRPSEAYVRIHNFPGLASGARYRVTFLVIGS